MAPVIRITSYRAVARRDLPLELPKGDSDLFPIAALLWIGGAVRVALTLLHRQAFDVEATLAMLWVLALPLYMMRTRRSHDSGRQ